MRVFDMNRNESEALMAWRVSELQFHDLFHQLTIGLCLITPEGKIMVADRQLCQMLGYSHKELLTKTEDEITHIEDRPNFTETMKQLLAGITDRVTLEKRYMRKDRSLIWAQVTCSVMRLDQLYVVAVIEDISRRRQIEEELRWAQERYSALFDRSMDGIYLHSLDGQMLDANPAALNLLGYSRDDIAKLDLQRLLGSAQMPLAKERIQQILNEGHMVAPDEYRVTGKDGKVVYLEACGSVVCLNGKPVAVQGIARDITDRKLAEEALRESEEKFRSLAENMHAAVGIVQGMRFMYANQFMSKMLGYSIEEILSLDFPGLVHPAERERLIDFARRRQLGESIPSHYEFMALTKGGETRWMDFSVGLMTYRGNPAIIGTGIDITERKAVEEQLNSYTSNFKLLSEYATRLLSTDRPINSLREIFESIADRLRAKIFLMYLVTDEGTRLRLEYQRGLDPAIAQQIEFVEFGQTPCATAAKEKRPVIIEDAQQSLEPQAEIMRLLGIHAYACHPLLGHKEVIGTISFCVEDRSRFSGGELELMRIAAHQAAMALEHQKLTEELELRAAELAQANAAKDHFLAVLSHELRTPLTPVVMGVSILQGKPDLDPNIRKTLEIIRLNVDMEARLIDDLLDVTRIARGKIELHRRSTELCNIIKRVVEICEPDIEARRLHFGVDMGPSAPYWINADAARLQQVFWNLLKNAIKFTPTGGCVGIRCRPHEGQVFVEVNDSGIGIGSDALPRIFNAFEQTERSITRQFGGLGLGLAISKALIELHGGEIEARSQGPGKGATFRVGLPLSAPAGQTPKPVGEAAGEVIPRPMRVLLVEDHGVTAQMIRMVLNEKGHTVEIAGDVATALSLAEQQPFDLLLSDLGLPDGSGHDLMQELRRRGHQFPAIALSGYGQESDVHQSYEAGFSKHLTKPVSREALVEAVSSVDTTGSRLSKPEAGHIDIGIFDMDLALKRCFSSREMLKEMVASFETDSKRQVDRMRAALDAKDIAEIAKAAHYLRGTVSYLGAQSATDAALKTEEAARSGDLASLTESLKELQLQIERLEKALIDSADWL